jgi:hypothetical protein
MQQPQAQGDGRGAHGLAKPLKGFFEGSAHSLGNGLLMLGHAMARHPQGDSMEGKVAPICLAERTQHS